MQSDRFRLGSRNVGALARKPLLQVLTRFESGFPSRSNADGLTRSGIPPHSGFRVLHFETPKSTKVYFSHRLPDCLRQFSESPPGLPPRRSSLHLFVLPLLQSIALCHPSQPKLLSDR